MNLGGLENEPVSRVRLRGELEVLEVVSRSRVGEEGGLRRIVGLGTRGGEWKRGGQRKGVRAVVLAAVVDVEEDPGFFSGRGWRMEKKDVELREGVGDFWWGGVSGIGERDEIMNLLLLYF